MWSPVLTSAGLLEPRCRTHYQLLGISANERNPGVIEEAAVRLSGQVRAYQLTCAPECSRLLDSIAQALVTLLDPVQRAQYDRGLGNPSAPVVPRARLAQPSAPATLGLVLVPCTGDGRAARPCDVEIVFRDPSV
jgi:hypothetical protein